MSKFTDSLLSIFASSFAEAGEVKLEEILQKLHDEKPELYDQAIQAGNILVTILLPLVDKTKTPIDNIFLEALADAIDDSAAANQVTLKPVESV